MSQVNGRRIAPDLHQNQPFIYSRPTPESQRISDVSLHELTDFINAFKYPTHVDTLADETGYFVLFTINIEGRHECNKLFERLKDAGLTGNRHEKWGEWEAYAQGTSSRPDLVIPLKSMQKILSKLHSQSLEKKIVVESAVLNAATASPFSAQLQDLPFLFISSAAIPTDNQSYTECIEQVIRKQRSENYLHREASGHFITFSRSLLGSQACIICFHELFGNQLTSIKLGHYHLEFECWPKGTNGTEYIRDGKREHSFTIEPMAPLHHRQAAVDNLRKFCSGDYPFLFLPVEKTNTGYGNRVFPAFAVKLGKLTIRYGKCMQATCDLRGYYVVFLNDSNKGFMECKACDEGYRGKIIKFANLKFEMNWLSSQRPEEKRMMCFVPI